MYLVLTALLALNVAKTILDAFVAIEENIQMGNINEYGRGTEKAAMISEKWKVDKSLKAKEIFEIVNKIDDETAKQIQLIDQTKLLVLMACKEEIKLGKGEERDRSLIVLDKGREGMKLNLDPVKPSVTNNPKPALPLRMKLEWVAGKDKYDDPMRVMGISKSEQLISPDPSGQGMKIWNSMIKYREFLINSLCEASTIIENMDHDSGVVAKKYSFKDPLIKEFETKEDVLKGLKKALLSVRSSDMTTASEVYLALLKKEMVEHEGKEIHWIGKTFDHAPSVAVLASLSSLQKDILAARALLIANLQEKVGGGDYSFNQVMGVATPDNMIVTSGEDFFVTVSMAAFDSEKQPIVKPNGGELVGKPANGKARLKFHAPASGKVEIKGTVSIEKKSGGYEDREYFTEVAVAPKSGALELPEVNVLYLNYDNIIVPSAPGVTDLNLAGGRATTYNGKKAFIVKPTAPGKKNLTLTGKGSDGKSVTIGSWEYKVKEMPPPILVTTTISRAGGRLNVAMAGGVLNVTYTIISGKCEDVSFQGGVIPAGAVSKVRPGKQVGVILMVKNNKTGITSPIRGSVTVQ